MRINLAGFNIDRDVLQQHVPANDPRAFNALTPETLSAAYARISRAPEPVDELRRKAAEDVAAARTSNEKIVFGYGHASVAEHAVFNFDLIDVSRLAIEAVEHARLCSYTEKSQRYVTFDRDKVEYVVPEEIIEVGLRNEFMDFIKETHDQYHFILGRIKDQERPQGGTAQEDARYVSTLAVAGQLGMTCNARNLETLIRRLVAHPLEEVRGIGQTLYVRAKDVAPSLLKYATPEPLRLAQTSKVQEALRLQCAGLFAAPAERVELLAATGNMEGGSGGDHIILSALVHQVSRVPFDMCFATVARLSPEQRKGLMLNVLSTMDVYSAAPRCFEMCDLTFELIVSASCFAQLKRHRMLTLLPQMYDPSLGYTIPASVAQDEPALERFKAVMRTAEAFYKKLARVCNESLAEYVLTQAHRRRALVKMNAREAYAFSRLREDKHAQWEIREIAQQVMGLARRVMPLTMALACGKDAFEEWRKQVLSC